MLKAYFGTFLDRAIEVRRSRRNFIPGPTDSTTLSISRYTSAIAGFPSTIEEVLQQVPEEDCDGFVTEFTSSDDSFLRFKDRLLIAYIEALGEISVETSRLMSEGVPFKDKIVLLPRQYAPVCRACGYDDAGGV